MGLRLENTSYIATGAAPSAGISSGSKRTASAVDRVWGDRYRPAVASILRQRATLGLRNVDVERDIFGHVRHDERATNFQKLI